MLMKPNRPAIQRHHPLAASLKLALPLHEGSGHPGELAFGMTTRLVGTGVSWTRGPRGPLLAFNGDPSSYLRTIKSDHLLLTCRSWSCFAIATRTVADAYDPIWFGAAGSGNTKVYALLDPAGQLHRWSDFATGFTCTLGVTYSILYTFDATSDTSGTETFYVDGARVASRTGSVPLTDTSLSFDLGAAGAAHGFTGTIDCPLLWVGRCLTQGDARALHADPFGVMRPSLARRLMPLGWRDLPPSIPGTATPAPAILAATAPTPVGHGGARAAPAAASATAMACPIGATGMVVATPGAASCILVVPDAQAAGGTGIPVLHAPMNNVYAALASDHAQGTGTLNVAAGQGERFGMPTPDRPIRVTVARPTAFGPNGDINPDGLTIYSVAGRSGDDLTGCTPIEDTPDRDYEVGDHVAMWFTAGALADVHQTLGTLQVMPPVPHEHTASDITDFDATVGLVADAAVAAHEMEVDPHPTYLRQAEADSLYMTPAAADAAFLTQVEADALFATPAEASALDSASISAHEAKPDPHPQYMTMAEVGGPYQPLDADLTLLATNNGSALTSLNATALATGTVSDARLSANVPRLNAANNFTGIITLSNTTVALHSDNSTSGDIRTLNINSFHNPASASGAIFSGLYLVPEVSSSCVANFNSVRGAFAIVNHFGTGRASELCGLQGYVQVSNAAVPGGTLLASSALGANLGVILGGTGNVSLAVCCMTSINQAGSGTMITAINHWVKSPDGTGPITFCEGIRVENQGRAGVGTSYGLRVSAQAGAGTTYAVLVEGGLVKFQAGDVVLAGAALATTATAGFTHLPTCAGPPTGAPAVQVGTVPMVVDTTNSKLYIRIGSTWKGVALT